jgi:type III pantothenate kinase
MLLALDAGNTQIVLGLINQGNIVCSWRLTTDKSRTEDELWVSIKLLCEDAGISVSKINRVIISSVVPQMNDTLFMLASEYLNTPPLFVKPDLPYRHDFLEGRFPTLGSDRICNMYAALTSYPLPQIIVDLGTATTYDILSPEGKYAGGAIAPGIRTSSANLFQAAAQLSGVPMRFPQTPIGTDTPTQLRSGILWGAVDQVDGMVRRIIKTTGWEFPVILATGGLAEMVAEKTETITETIPDLTLQGLNIIADEIIPET